VTALLFDLDDTLLDYSTGVEVCWGESCATVAAPAGVDPVALAQAVAEVQRWFWADPVRHRRERIDMIAAWGKIAAGALECTGGARDGLAAALAADFAGRRRAAMRLFPDALDVLARFRLRGVPLGLVTNGDARLQREKIQRYDLARFFDVLVIEGEFGAGKPDAEVFHHALAVLGTAPAAAWMVGDHLVWDVAGAQGAGLRAAWIDRRRGGLPAASPARPDRIVHSLSELSDLG
jgi:putative hydrolase of the HAD superfamily